MISLAVSACVVVPTPYLRLDPLMRPYDRQIVQRSTNGTAKQIAENAKRQLLRGKRGPGWTPGEASLALLRIRKAESFQPAARPSGSGISQNKSA